MFTVYDDDDVNKPSNGVFGKFLDALYCLIIFGTVLVLFVIPLIFLVWIWLFG